jgi:hypothetical protein
VELHGRNLEALIVSPETTAKTIVSRIGYLIQRGGVTPLEVASVKRDITSLKRVDAALSFMISGMLHAVLGDYETSVKDHKEGIKRAPNDSVQLQNFGTSLVRLSRFDEAFFYYSAAFNLDPSLGHLEGAQSTLFGCGLITEFSAMVETFKKAHPESLGDHRVVVAIQDHENLKSWLASVDISEADFRRVCGHFSKVMQEYNAVLEQHLAKLSKFSERHISLMIKVSKSPTEMQAMGDRLENLIITDEKLDHCWDKVIFNFYAYDRKTA